MSIISHSTNLPSVSEVVDMKYTVRWGCVLRHTTCHFCKTTCASSKQENALEDYNSRQRERDVRNNAWLCFCGNLLHGEPSRFVRLATRWSSHKLNWKQKALVCVSIVFFVVLLVWLSVLFCAVTRNDRRYKGCTSQDASPDMALAYSCVRFAYSFRFVCWGSTSDTCQISCFPRSVWRKPSSTPVDSCFSPFTLDGLQKDLIGSSVLSLQLVLQHPERRAIFSVLSDCCSYVLRQCEEIAASYDVVDGPNDEGESRNREQRNEQKGCVLAETDTFLLCNCVYKKIRSCTFSVLESSLKKTVLRIAPSKLLSVDILAVLIRRDVHPSWHSRWCLPIAISERRGTFSQSEREVCKDLLPLSTNTWISVNTTLASGKICRNFSAF